MTDDDLLDVIRTLMIPLIEQFVGKFDLEEIAKAMLAVARLVVIPPVVTPHDDMKTLCPPVPIHWRRICFYATER